MKNPEMLEIMKASLSNVEKSDKNIDNSITPNSLTYQKTKSSTPTNEHKNPKPNKKPSKKIVKLLKII